MTPDVDIREDECHSTSCIYQNTNLAFQNMNVTFFCKKKSDVSEFFLFFVIVHLFKSRLLANRGRLLLRTPGPVPFGTCICSNVETILSRTCHVYGPFEFRTSLGTSILLLMKADMLSYKPPPFF